MMQLLTKEEYKQWLIDYNAIEPGKGYHKRLSKLRLELRNKLIADGRIKDE